MASEADIANRALQMLGAKRIVSLTDDESKNARACNACYEILRDSEIRLHPWNFAINRAELAADATAPAFGRARAFQLPSTCLRVLPPYPEEDLEDLDWIVEGKKIYTDDSAPLQVRYLQVVTDPNEMDSLFREALSAKMAMEMCEEITQSNTKGEALERRYVAAIAKAKKANAIEHANKLPPDDSWITARV
jgi:hypothetical protein